MKLNTEKTYACESIVNRESHEVGRHVSVPIGSIHMPGCKYVSGMRKHCRSVRSEDVPASASWRALNNGAAMIKTFSEKKSNFPHLLKGREVPLWQASPGSARIVTKIARVEEERLVL